MTFATDAVGSGSVDSVFVDTVNWGLSEAGTPGAMKEIGEDIAKAIEKNW